MEWAQSGLARLRSGADPKVHSCTIPRRLNLYSAFLEHADACKNSMAVLARQGKADLIHQDTPLQRTQCMCSQDDMVEGVGGDDGNVQPQCGTSCGTLCHWRTRVCGERVQTAAAIRCSNHVRMPDPSNAIMPLEELRATRHALMEHGPGIVSPRALSVRVGPASAGWIMCK